MFREYSNQGGKYRLPVWIFSRNPHRESVFMRATSQSLCLHEILATAAIT